MNSPYHHIVIQMWLSTSLCHFIVYFPDGVLNLNRNDHSFSKHWSKGIEYYPFTELYRSVTIIYFMYHIGCRFFIALIMLQIFYANTFANILISGKINIPCLFLFFFWGGCFFLFFFCFVLFFCFFWGGLFALFSRLIFIFSSTTILPIPRCRLGTF